MRTYVPDKLQRGRLYNYGKRWKRDGAKPLCSENIDGLQPHT